MKTRRFLAARSIGFRRHDGCTTAGFAVNRRPADESELNPDREYGPWRPCAHT